MKRLGLIIFLAILFYLTYDGVIRWDSFGRYFNAGEPARQVYQDAVFELEHRFQKEAGEGVDNSPYTGTFFVNDNQPQTHAAQGVSITRFYNGRAELFMKDSCDDCHYAKEFLEDRGVWVICHDVEHNKAAKIRHRRLDRHERVPLAIINGQLVIRFSRKKYVEALEKH